MHKKPKCEFCKWYGHKVGGCFHGGSPSRSDPCLHPHLFEAKQMPPSYELGTPTEWHIVHEKPREREKSRSQPTKKAVKKTVPQRDGKGRFMRREK
jgi:hypothetical protein